MDNNTSVKSIYIQISIIANKSDKKRNPADKTALTDTESPDILLDISP